MTRQKKEIIKRIQTLETWIDADRALANGFEPPHAYDKGYEEIERLWDQLARLQRYQNKEEMLFDPRGCVSAKNKDLSPGS